MNASLLIIKVQVDGVRCSALIDTGSSQSIVSANWCTAWSTQLVDMWTIDRMSQARCWIGTMSILTNGGGHAEVNILVECERPLGYNLLIGIDGIQALGGVMITPAGDMKLGEGKEACAANCIGELDFDASFDHNERKWTLDNAPTLLHNQVAEYKIANNIRGKYERELQMWITNSWLIPYLQE